MDRLRASIRIARQLIESYKENNGDIGSPVMVIPPHLMDTNKPVPIEGGILYEITRLSKVNVVWKRVQTSKTQYVEALYWRPNEKEAWGIVPSFHNRCWSRFLLCKELIHVLLDDDENRTTGSEDSKNLINALLSGLPESFSKDAETDMVAKFAAMEMLLPKEFEKDINDMFEAGQSAKDIANSYLVPEDMVKIRFQKHIKDFFSKMYHEIEIEQRMK
jgi:hypothetical protein